MKHQLMGNSKIPRICREIIRCRAHRYLLLITLITTNYNQSPLPPNPSKPLVHAPPNCPLRLRLRPPILRRLRTGPARRVLRLRTDLLRLVTRTRFTLFLRLRLRFVTRPLRDDDDLELYNSIALRNLLLPPLTNCPFALRLSPRRRRRR